MPYNEFQKIVDEIVQSDIVVLEEYSTENGYDENFDVTDIHITGSRKHYFTHELKYDNGVEKTLTLPAMKFLSVRTWDKVRDYICAKHGSSSHYRRNRNLFFIDWAERAF